MTFIGFPAGRVSFRRWPAYASDFEKAEQGIRNQIWPNLKGSSEFLDCQENRARDSSVVSEVIRQDLSLPVEQKANSAIYRFLSTGYEIFSE